MSLHIPLFVCVQLYTVNLDLTILWKSKKSSGVNLITTYVPTITLIFITVLTKVQMVYRLHSSKIPSPWNCLKCWRKYLEIAKTNNEKTPTKPKTWKFKVSLTCRIQIKSKDNRLVRQWNNWTIKLMSCAIIYRVPRKWVWCPILKIEISITSEFFGTS